MLFTQLLSAIEIAYACLDTEAVGRELTLVCDQDPLKSESNSKYWGIESAQDGDTIFSIDQGYSIRAGYLFKFERTAVS